MPGRHLTILILSLLVTWFSELYRGINTVLLYGFDIHAERNYGDSIEWR